MSSKIICDKCGKEIKQPYCNTRITVTVDGHNIFAGDREYDFCHNCFEGIKAYVRAGYVFAGVDLAQDSDITHISPHTPIEEIRAFKGLRLLPDEKDE